MFSVDLKLQGYDYLGTNGEEGLRFAWKHPNIKEYVESAAFCSHSKSIADNVCGYTTSVSGGCVLDSMNLACRFCRTGTQLPFGKLLTAEEIAKQNVFMVLSDIYCNNNPELKNKEREFAYMGQGEPGYSYAQVRKAIQMTNVAMNKLEQKVFRHIVATSGVEPMIEEYIHDLKQGFYSSRTTFHFSLHMTQCRNELMPINIKYPYQHVLKQLEKIYPLTREKPCIGILLFNNFFPCGSLKSYTTSMESVKVILKELNPNLVRLSFCEFNDSPDLGEHEQFDARLSHEILAYAQKEGFTAKLFSSFGKKETTACGMLGGKEPSIMPSEKWIELEKKTEKIIAEVTKQILGNCETR